jgi:PIN domain nuclease of toxin-antitoxin system
MIRPILLDTCAAIWISQGNPISAPADDALNQASAVAGAIVVSPISAWEIGILVARKRIALSRDPVAWFQAMIDAGVELAPMPPEILVASSFLPESTLRDPADRILAATARAMNYRLMTRDCPMLDYASEGHLAAIRC